MRADGSVLHRTAIAELTAYGFPSQTRDYITASGTTVLLRNDGLRLAAYARNGVRLYDIEVPDQMHQGNYPSATVHVLPDGSAVRQSLVPGQTDLSIASTEALGNCRLRAGGRQEKLDRESARVWFNWAIAAAIVMGGGLLILVGIALSK